MHKQGALREFGHYAAMNILGMIGISCYILADTYFVAQGLGSLGLAALNIAIPAYNLMNGIGLMLGVGAATQYTIARAQNDRRQADSSYSRTRWRSDCCSDCCSCSADCALQNRSRACSARDDADARHDDDLPAACRGASGRSS